MTETITWRKILKRDFNRLHDAFNCYTSEFKPECEPKLIDLAERYKSYVADYDGKRYVFVFAESDDSQLVGLVIYDRSSRKILYVIYDEHKYEIMLYFLRLILRLATEGRIDVFEAFLSRIGVSLQLINFFGFCYMHLGDEFVAYLYENYRDILDRLIKDRIIYGRNFVFLPMMDTILIRLNDGSILYFPTDVMFGTTKTVTEFNYPLFHKFLSYLIDSAEELDRNMIIHEGEYQQYKPGYAFSLVSPPNWRGKYAVVFAGKFYRGLSGREIFGEANIFFVECNGLCKMHSLRNILDYMNISRYEPYKAYSIAKFIQEHGYDDYTIKFLEYIIGSRDKFPPEFIDEVYRRYLNMNVMNIIS